jgi:hypothetical protein
LNPKYRLLLAFLLTLLVALYLTVVALQVRG